MDDTGLPQAPDATQWPEGSPGGEPGSKTQSRAKHSGSCSPAVLPLGLLGVVV